MATNPTHLVQLFAKGMVFVILAAAGCLASGLALQGLVALYQGQPLVMDLSPLTLAPMGALLLMGAVLATEVHYIGYPRSSLRHLINGSPSSRTDLLYLFVYVSNLAPVLAFIASASLGYGLHWLITTLVGTNLFLDLTNPIGFALMWLIGPLLFYIVHRIHHTDLFWEFHKVHHAAEEMTVANNFRNHPATVAVRVAFDAIPPMLGVPPLALLAYSISHGVLVLFQHSNLTIPLGPLERYVIIGARGHRLHHANDPAYIGKNMGTVVFWDWLFGTLALPPDTVDDIKIGVDPSPLHNSGHPLQELVTVQQEGVRVMWKSIKGLAHS